MEQLLDWITMMRCFICFPHSGDGSESNNLAAFLTKRLPIFWIMGPPGSGKSTLAEMLAKSSNYRLLKIEQLIREEANRGKQRGRTIQDHLSKGIRVPDDIILDVLKETLIYTHNQSIGYIIDDFPRGLKQAKKFESEICQVNIIIYVTLVLDALLARMLSNHEGASLDELRIRHIKSKKRLKKVYKKYEHKTIKVHSNYPPEDTCTHIIENLEDFWGYKFQRLYNKN